MDSPVVNDIKNQLHSISNSEKIKVLSNFFKSSEGQYGEGDQFWGITVPQNREIAKQFVSISFDDINLLINDRIHEVRVCGFLILVDKYKQAKKDNIQKDEIVSFFLSVSDKANNWDLVDLSCPKILGLWIVENRKRLKKDGASDYNSFGKDILKNLSSSNNLWKKRISIVSTWTMIREGFVDDTFDLAEYLLFDSHDLIQKAVGWMLREAGKKDISRLNQFLEIYADSMPRTTLRYAIEKHDKDQKEYYMKKKKR